METMKTAVDTATAAVWVETFTLAVVHELQHYKAYLTIPFGLY